jgi:uncharacterized membrane protein YgaE (UPF0421/DUF939 family)
VTDQSVEARLQSLRDYIAKLQKSLSSGQRLIMGLEHGIMSAAAALIAYLPAKALGLQQSFWGAVTAIAVVQTEFGATRTSARDQFTGAATGGLIGVAIVSVIGQEIISYTAAVIVSITACWMLNVTSAARLSGVTATIIMLVPHADSVQSMMVARVSEVAWGVSVAVGVVWLASNLGLANKS